MARPKISLVIPTHQREALLRELLLSLGEQTLAPTDFEAIVVVDGAVDGTWGMLQSLDTPYRLRPVQQQQAGAPAARNHGARLAEGEVLVFLDDDMLPGEGFLAEHLRIHQAHPQAVVLGSYIPPSLGLVAGQGGWNVWEARVLEHHYREVADGKRPPAGRRLYSGNFSVRPDDFWRVGGFDESLERGEDVELGFRLERAGLSYHFSHGTGALHRGFRGFDSWCRSAYLYGKYDALFASQKGHRVMPEVLRWYHRQKAIARWTIGLCMEREWLRKLTFHTLRIASEKLTDAKLYGLAHFGYSGIYKLQYWRGFVDELGGKVAFKTHAVAWRNAGQNTGSSDQTSGHVVR